MQKVYRLIYIPFVALLMNMSSSAYANTGITQAYIDSVSFHYFQLGNWDEVIQTGKLAKENDINFKWLQQRIGYAYFNKKQYYKSMQHYEKALAFDNKDEITRLYLYYIGINTGSTAYARYQAGKLSDASRTYIDQKEIKLFDAIDLEFNYKNPDTSAINNAFYQRIGLNTLFGYQFSLYQTLSNFSQSTDTTATKQKEYFALISWNPAARTNLSLGYHYVGTKVNDQYSNTYLYPGHMIYGAISQKVNRFDLTVSGANFNNDWIDTKQYGLQLGVGFAGGNNIYLTSSYFKIYETSYNNTLSRNIFKQTAGIMLFDRLWTEASINFGNLNHFIDNNGMYLYNSLDPTTFRTGLSVFGYVSKPLTLYLNYTFDNKFIVTSQQQYNQHSITGGIIWKI